MANTEAFHNEQAHLGHSIARTSYSPGQNRMRHFCVLRFKVLPNNEKHQNIYQASDRARGQLLFPVSS